MTNEWTKTWN